MPKIANTPNLPDGAAQRARENAAELLASFKNMWRSVRGRKKRAFLAFYSATHNISGSARAAQVPRRTIYNWMETDEKFRQAVEDVEEARMDACEARVFQLALVGDTARDIPPSERSLHFILETKGRSRGFGRNVEVAGGVSVDHVVHTVEKDFDKLLDDRRGEIIDVEALPLPETSKADSEE